MKRRQPQMLDPWSSQLGPLLIIWTRNIVTTKVLVELPLEFGSITCTGIIGTCNCLEVSVSHEDSTISHPRDQDYLSLRVGKGYWGQLQQALAYMVANLCKWEREEKQRTVEKIIVIKKWSWSYLHSSITRDRVLFPDSVEKTPARLHMRLIHFN